MKGSEETGMKEVADDTVYGQGHRTRGIRGASLRRPSPPQEAGGTAQGSGGGGLLVGSVSAMSKMNTECLQKCMREGVGSLGRGPAAVSSWNLQETGGHVHAHPGQDRHLGLRCFTQSPVSLSVRVLCPQKLQDCFS